MVLLRDFIGKNVRNSYLRETVGDHSGYKAPKIFLCHPAIAHHDCIYLLNGLTLFSNVSWNKML